MPYRNWADSDTLNAADLNAMTADPNSAEVVTQETTTSTTYAALATAGPAVTLSMVTGQAALVIVQARIHNSVAGNATYANYQITGASGTIVPNDENGAETTHDVNSRGRITRISVFAATATGSHTFTMLYKVFAGTGTFSSRRIIVKKF
jgi:hypothetical protein